MKTRYLYAFYAAIVVLAVWVGWRYEQAQFAFFMLKRAELGTYIGPADSSKILTEVVDYRCHPCRNIYPVIKEFHERNPDVKIVIKYLPVYMKPSIKEAGFALAAAMQGKFAVVHDLLMMHGEAPMTDDEMAAIVKELNLDPEKLKKDSRGAETGDELMDTLEATRTLKIKSVPTIIINKKVFIMDSGMPGVEDIEKMMKTAYGAAQK